MPNQVSPEPQAATVAIAASKNRDFRRASIGLGEQPNLQALTIAHLPISLRNRYKPEVEWFDDHDLDLLSAAYTDHVSALGNLEANITSFHENLMPDPKGGITPTELANLNSRLLCKIAKTVKPYMKLARVGSTVRIGLCVFLSYQDMVSDVGVAIQFRRAGQLGWFNLSIGFVVGAAASHAVFSLVNNRNRPLSVKIRGVVLSFLLLNPLLDGYAVWTGEPQHPDATFTPGVMLGGTRSIE